MKNVNMEVNGNELVIRIDMTKDHGPSSSGKTRIVASTEGNIELENGVRIGINAFKYPETKTTKKAKSKSTQAMTTAMTQPQSAIETTELTGVLQSIVARLDAIESKPKRGKKAK